MAEEYIVNAKFNTNDAVKGAQKLNDSLEDVNDTLEDTNDAAADLGKSVDEVTGGSVSKFKGLLGSVKMVTKGFFTLKGAIAATGLGLLLIAIMSIKKAFTSSEEGQNRYAKLMAVLGTVVGNISDILTNLGNSLIDVFTNPMQALEDFGNGIKTFILDRIKMASEGFGLLGTAIDKMLDGDFSGAAKDLGKGLLEINRGINPTVIATELVVKGISNTIKATKELVAESLKEAKIAAGIADQKALADKIDRELLVERQKENIKLNELKNKAAQVDKFTVEERIAFLEEAGRIEEEISNKEIEAARLRFEAKKLENTLSNSTKEDLQEEAELEARLLQLQSDKLVRSKEVIGVAAGLRAADIAKKKAEADAEIAAEQAKQDSIEGIIEGFDKKRQDKAAETEIQKLELEQERTLAELERLGATEQQKLDVIAYFKDQKALLDEADAKKEKARLEALSQARKAKLNSDLSAIENFAGRESAVGKAAFIAKQALLLKEQIIEAKASLQKMGLFAAEATASSAVGVANTAKIGFPQNIPMLIAFAAQAVGIIATVKSAVSAAKGKASAMGGGGGSIGSIQAPQIPTATSAPSQPAAFNVVGSSETSQLAETISAQNDKPIKTYVTSQDVTSAQSLDRNIIETASI